MVTPLAPTGSSTAPDGGAAPAPSPREHGTYAMGVDVARDRVRVALVDATGTVRARAERRDVRATVSARARAAAGLLRSVTEDVEARLGAGHRVRVRRAVAAFPSVVAPDHASVYRVPGYEKGGTGLRDGLAVALECPVELENDVNLAALAEARQGAARQARSSVTLMLGAGFGAGIVLDGHLHRGHAGIAGEVGFIPQPGRALGSPVLGEVALAALVKEHGLSDSLTIGDVVDRCEAGDALAAEVVDEVARRVAVTVASIELVLDPDLFVLGDQAARPPVHDRAAQILRDTMAVLPTRVVASPLGADAVVLGAALAASEGMV